MASQVIKDQKRQQIDEIKAKIENASSIVIVDYKGLTVAQDTTLRKNFRAAGVEYKVLKNRLVKIAFNELGYTEFDNDLEGPSALAFGGEDIGAPARIAMEGIKSFNKMSTKCGLLEKKFIDNNGIQSLAALPTREVLLAKMLGSMLAPISKLAYVLKAIGEKDSAPEVVAE